MMMTCVLKRTSLKSTQKRRFRMSKKNKLKEKVTLVSCRLINTKVPEFFIIFRYRNFFHHSSLRNNKGYLRSNFYNVRQCRHYLKFISEK